MTTIISRLYDSPDTAAAAAEALRAAGHDPETIAVLAPEPGDAAAIAAAGVGHVSAAAYARALAPGQAMLVVRAPITPFGRARAAMRIADGFGPRSVPGVNANQHVPDQPRPQIFHPAIARHAHVMTRDMPPHIDRRRGLVSAAFGLPLLWRRARPRATLTDGAHPSRWFWPLPLLWRRTPAATLLPSGSFPSRRFWPLPLLSGRSA